jgi:hypothetical protein
MFFFFAIQRTTRPSSIYIYIEVLLLLRIYNKLNTRAHHRREKECMLFKTVNAELYGKRTREKKCIYNDIEKKVKIMLWLSFHSLSVRIVYIHEQELTNRVREQVVDSVNNSRKHLHHNFD